MEALHSKRRIRLVLELRKLVRKRVRVAHSVVECALNGRTWRIGRVIFDMEEDGVVIAALATMRESSGHGKVLLV